ncbi:hypothetical protein G4B88_014940 [Cannabis sativa]|uniref:Protein kinase domain-containing protein n=1 Tax=Cannabis sativa TaxID=3483 RepID=A0A7J6F6M3_CANSA|nr:hypothetical protein G4B88_014940 [Cannabis sativa]
MVKRDSFISLAFSKVGFLQVMTYVHNIALGTAKGLAYLHNGCNHKIIQCDVKPDNILMLCFLVLDLCLFGFLRLRPPHSPSNSPSISELNDSPSPSDSPSTSELNDSPSPSTSELNDVSDNNGTGVLQVEIDQSSLIIVANIRPRFDRTPPRS